MSNQTDCVTIAEVSRGFVYAIRLCRVDGEAKSRYDLRLYVRHDDGTLQPTHSAVALPTDPLHIQPLLDAWQNDLDTCSEG